MSVRPLGALLLLAASAGADTLPGRFPCDTRALSSLPALVLLGENHEHPRSARLRAEVMRAGAEGRLFALVEATESGPLPGGPLEGHTASLGLPLGPSRLFGIENSLASTYVDLWLYSSANSPIRLGGAKDVDHLLERIARSAEFRLPFAGALAKGAISDPRGAELVRGALRAAEPGPLGLRLSPPPATDADVGPFRAAIAAARVEMAAEMSREYGDRRAYRIVQELGPEADTSALETGVMKEIRDRDYALAAASMYCSAAQEGKALFVVVGAGHAPGMLERLRAWSAAPLPVLEADTRTADGEAKLRSWLAPRPSARAARAPDLEKVLARPFAP